MVLNAKNFGIKLNKQQFDKKFKSNSAFFTLKERFLYSCGWNFE